MTSAMKILHFPKTRLSELVARSGGISREDALEAAKEGMEEFRDLAVETIESGIGVIEALAYSAKGGRLAEAQMREILVQADHVVTMTATFGISVLEGVAKSLCDVADGLLTRGLDDAAPIIVHVQALRLMAPRSAPLEATHAQQVLAELTKLREHFSITPLSAIGG
jgi:hypothetical protein